MTFAAPIQTDDALDGKRIHALASLFPPMSDDEFAAICEDVKSNGLVEPIILLDGEVLDGIHRLRACLSADITPRYQDWNGEGGTPLQYRLVTELDEAASFGRPAGRHLAGGGEGTGQGRRPADVPQGTCGGGCGTISTGPRVWQSP